MVNYILTATAKKEYSKNKETNKNIYDSHLGNTGKDIIFPKDFDLPTKYSEKILNKIQEILFIVSRTFQDEIECYSESKNCFEVLGADFMVTNEFDVKLLEINTKVSFQTYDKKIKDQLSKAVFEDIFSQFVLPIFFNKNKKPLNWEIIYEE